MTPIKFSLVQTTDDAFISVFLPGRNPLPANSTHPNFQKIVGLCNASIAGDAVDVDALADLFDVAATVARKFARLSERITVDADGIKVDGDPVDGVLADQILNFLDEGLDFDPLVKFYEKLLNNPLGEVQESLYAWIKGLNEGGVKVTITDDGDVIGYKGVWPVADKPGFYKPSRSGPAIINGAEVNGCIAQSAGDVVEMPRRTLSAPSHECGVGLHIGTYKYAKSFGPVTLAVKFSPRDVVSAPDANSSWKVRVCRYTVLGVVEAPATESVYNGRPQSDLDVSIDRVEFKPGDRAETDDGDRVVIIDGEDEDGEVYVRYEDDEDGEYDYIRADDLTPIRR